uniref:Sensory neuron membrane protein 2 n=1 Tax=Subpsaltria yangi TaxID=1195109 RepID=A0A385IUR3_9HEMI|nr:sensory neuron membrane protein 2e [Subpsaltria yangi]
MTPCLNAPIIASFPHLYLADKEYQSYITGLHPNKTLHETYVDIDPLTGYPLQGAKRMQLNMFLEKIDGVDILANVSTGLLPLVWIEEVMFCFLFNSTFKNSIILNHIMSVTDKNIYSTAIQ